jgi:plasmid stability protein
MADLLIRNVPATTLAVLKDRAKLRGRSVQAEALEALTAGARPTGKDLVAWLKTIRPAVGDPDAGIAAIREARDER